MKSACPVCGKSEHPTIPQLSNPAPSEYRGCLGKAMFDAGDSTTIRERVAGADAEIREDSGATPSARSSAPVRDRFAERKRAERLRDRATESGNSADEQAATLAEDYYQEGCE